MVITLSIWWDLPQFCFVIAWVNNFSEVEQNTVYNCSSLNIIHPILYICTALAISALKASKTGLKASKTALKASKTLLKASKTALKASKELRTHVMSTFNEVHIPHQRLLLFLWARNLTLISQYWLIQGKNLRIFHIHLDIKKLWQTILQIQYQLYLWNF